LSTARISFGQDKVHEELHRIFGDSGRAATSRDLREMQYLELCIKEAMRMFPVAPIIARHLTGDVALCKYRCAPRYIVLQAMRMFPVIPAVVSVSATAPRVSFMQLRPLLDNSCCGFSLCHCPQGLLPAAETTVG
jgi:hypothetical protein